MSCLHPYDIHGKASNTTRVCKYVVITYGFRTSRLFPALLFWVDYIDFDFWNDQSQWSKIYYGKGAGSNSPGVYLALQI